MKEGYEEVRYARGNPMRGHYAYLEDGRGIDQCSVGTAAVVSHMGVRHSPVKRRATSTDSRGTHPSSPDLDSEPGMHRNDLQGSLWIPIR